MPALLPSRFGPLLILLGSLLFSWGAAWPAVGGELRLAVVVGNNVGADDEEPLRYAESEALELYKVLLELGGIKPNDAYLLLGKKAKALHEALADVTRRVRVHAARDRVVLIFFYTGHASTTTLHMSGSRLSLTEIKRMLAAAAAATTIVFVDACKSGSILRTKGVEAAMPFDIRIDERTSATGSVFVTSSGPSEVSLEAEDLRGSLFSHYLISALRGAADTDLDGRVDLAEAYRFTYNGTLNRSAQSGYGTQHPGFDYDLRGTDGLVLTWPTRAEAVLRIGPELDGSFIVVSKHTGRVMAEVIVEPGASKKVALPARSYLIKQRAKGGYRVGEVDLAWGGEMALEAGSMEFVSFESMVEKGTGPPPDVNQLGLVGLLRTGAPEGNDLLGGAALGYARRLAERVRLQVALAYLSGSTESIDFPIPTHGFSLRGSCAFATRPGPVVFDLGGLVGGRVAWQEMPGLADRYSFGLELGVETVMRWAFWEPMFMQVGLIAGMEILRVDDEAKVFPMVEFGLGFGMRI